jgi:hypothetical protein
MLKYFTGSYLMTAAGLIAAWFWGEHVLPGTGWASVFIAFVLSVLEVSLSFDNAVVNAVKLEQMTDVWRHRFLTWGILVAVFGMRLLFPLAIVAIFAGVNMLAVAQMALSDVDKYAYYLHETHAPIVAFGGIFLMMLFLGYFFNHEKDVHWIKPLEEPMSHLDQVHGIETIISMTLLVIAQHFAHAPILVAGIAGLITYLLIDGVSAYLEKIDEEKFGSMGDDIKRGGFVAFLYLELIDASFSLDGVLGAFALSKDIVIIMIGLAIGAMFVRSLTIMLVEKKTLKQFRYLEHGAHWAIGVLAGIMIISTAYEVPEVITGLTGLVLIIASLISSICYNKKQARLIA